uniref:Transmembrane protein 100 n=1 Tax=Gasterosteus aculeatus aculeatus TaxID=481459 RepID=A0AAQ4PYX6_GASAC
LAHCLLLPIGPSSFPPCLFSPRTSPDTHTLKSEANTLPQDSENQNQGKRPETLATLERLAQATGGTEKSWYRCVFPFGVISLVIGMAGTGVTFTFNTLLQTKVVSVALLCAGVVMLLVAAVCWRAHRLRRRKKKEGGFFAADQATL